MEGGKEWGGQVFLDLQRFTEIVSYRDTFSDDTRIVSWGHFTIC